jgi:NAD(P)-dependent dehydrogenase (short-subunit alcohol dehydrogenase family)
LSSLSKICIRILLSAAGANVLFNGFAQEEIIKLEKEPTNIVSFTKFIYADLILPSDTMKLIENSISDFGNIGILVNNIVMQHIDAF